MSFAALAKRPWLLVWVAFFALIAGWVATYKISLRAPSKAVTPAEEAALVERRERAR